MNEVSKEIDLSIGWNEDARMVVREKGWGKTYVARREK